MSTRGQGPEAGDQDSEELVRAEHTPADVLNVLNDARTPASCHSDVTPDAPAPSPEPPAPIPFWGYADLFLFAGLAVPAMLAGFGLVKAVLTLFHLHPIRAAEVLTEQFIGYLFLFLVLVVIFRFQYRRPFWASLGWTPIMAPPMWIVIAGWVTAFLVVFAGYLIRTPTTSNPLTELMQDRVSIALIGIFGVTLGPMAEELAFRGFLQPLLVRSFGVFPGILLAALPFGVLHFSEYGNSWRHVVLICAAGVAFGFMRQVTGSTKASTLMHSAYNALFFAALWGSKR
jgi:membrane protease YdiL (CAAX protease family)